MKLTIAERLSYRRAVPRQRDGLEIKRHACRDRAAIVGRDEPVTGFHRATSRCVPVGHHHGRAKSSKMRNAPSKNAIRTSHRSVPAESLTSRTISKGADYHKHLAVASRKFVAPSRRPGTISVAPATMSAKSRAVSGRSVRLN
jgi:hypothetical protein